SSLIWLHCAAFAQVLRARPGKGENSARDRGSRLTPVKRVANRSRFPTRVLQPRAESEGAPKIAGNHALLRHFAGAIGHTKRSALQPCHRPSRRSEVSRSDRREWLARRRQRRWVRPRARSRHTSRSGI